MHLMTLNDLSCLHKRLVIREDFNVPIEKGLIVSDARIQAALPTIRYALEQQAALILLSHLGRPQEGCFSPEFSLAPVAERLQSLLGQPVKFISHWLEGFDIAYGEVVLCENVRFERGERTNDPYLAKKIARLGDIFVMDAFATAHRSEASTVGAIQFSPQACAGPLLVRELTALSRILENPARPLLAIVGGAKVSSKLKLLSALLEKVDTLIVGGGMANTFLAAQGYPIGRSLYESDLIDEAKCLLKRMEQNRAKLVLPEDVIVSTEVSSIAKTRVKRLTEIDEDEIILDVGPVSLDNYLKQIEAAGSIFWNGPMGVFEMAPFEQGTKALSLAIAQSSAFSVAGGGDTLAAIEKYAIADKISYISTGGGAFLELVEGSELPALFMLRAHARGKTE